MRVERGDRAPPEADACLEPNLNKVRSYPVRGAVCEGEQMTSREYLQRALECARLSLSLPDAISRGTFAALAKTWIELADTEEARSLVDPLEGRTRK
jgi:hypothetical protein